MDLRLKLTYKQNQENKDLAVIYDSLISNRDYKECKVSTKKLEVEKDKKDERNISSIRKVELTLELKEGFLILKGHLSASFKSPFGGEFHLIDYKIIPNGNFIDLGGVQIKVLFENNYPMDLNQMFNSLQELSNDPNFVFNIAQFDEFMEVFTFYKKLSDEINNSATFKIIKSSDPYFFISVDNKELYDQSSRLRLNYAELIAIHDNDNIIKGYQVPGYIFERFNNDLKENTLKLVDIRIDNKENNIRKILRMKENLFISDHVVIDEQKAKLLKSLELINYIKSKDDIILSVISDKEIEELYLNLYDMGQKIKIESIEASLKLINRGTTEASMHMIEFLIGDKPMPSKTERVRDQQLFVERETILNPHKIGYMRNLNDSQKLAFIKALDGSPVTLIKGPPGTGKTHVINAITQFITKELKEKVIISSQTHVAIDNVLDKLMENHDLIVPHRITNRRNKYSADEIDKTLYKTWGSKLKQNLINIENKDLLEDILKDLDEFKGIGEIQYSKNMKEDFYVIGATTTTSAISGKKGLEILKGYKWLIIDEVSKSPITEVLRYLPYVDKIILVGDDFQLSPLLEFSKEDVKHLQSYDEDMFEKLETIYEQSVFSKTIKKADEGGRLILLDENYRSVKPVLDTYNLFYDGKLKNRREETSPKIIQFKPNSILKNDKHVYFVEPLGSSEIDDQKSHSRYNVQESLATAIILKEIIEQVENPHNVTVSAIFPYAAQIAYFSKHNIELINQAKKVLKSFELDTVDAFQGRETDIVLVNTVVTRPEKRNFLRDFRRINVSMSRARDKLIVFGNRSLEKMEMLSPNGETQQYFKKIIEVITIYGEKIEISQNGDIIKHDSKRKIEFA